jgi:hypothetical protein
MHGGVHETIDEDRARGPLSTSYLIGSPFIEISMMTLNASGILSPGGDLIEGHVVQQYGGWGRHPAMMPDFYWHQN